MNDSIIHMAGGQVSAASQCRGHALARPGNPVGVWRARRLGGKG